MVYFFFIFSHVIEDPWLDVLVGEEVSMIDVSDQVLLERMSYMF